MMATAPETIHDVSERISAHQRSCSVNLRWAIGILAGIAMTAMGSYVSMMRSLETLTTHQAHVADTLRGLAVRDEKLDERLRSLETRLYGRSAQP